jgi:CelD/BcsL family acetyltransferase involved in cellulose biosynthesis
MTAVLGPLQSFAFTAKALVTIASEKATLRVALTGAPTGAAMTRVRIYHVVMSPSGNG